MTEETWTITLGDNTYEVPRMPIKASRKVYPICQRLSNAGLPARLSGSINAEGEFVPPPPLEVSDEEFADLIEIAFVACVCADYVMTRDIFDDMPITPSQLYDTFFAVRFACGGWRKPEEGQKMGEGEGTEKSPT